jgi:hypothetical protein
VICTLAAFFFLINRLRSYKLRLIPQISVVVRDRTQRHERRQDSGRFETESSVKIEQASLDKSGEVMRLLHETPISVGATE